MDNKVVIKKKMRVGDRMVFSNGVDYQLYSPPIEQTQFDGPISAEIIHTYSKNWFSVLFKVPREIKFTFIKGERSGKEVT